MSTPRTYPPGVPCWVDAEQRDTDAACRFYGALFGRTFADAVPPGIPDSYLIASLDGWDVAAIAPAASDTAPPDWNTYVAVESADAAAAAASAAGGTIEVEPVDAGPGGRYAVCADRSGARFRLWEARRRLGAQLVNAPGTWLRRLRGLKASRPKVISVRWPRPARKHKAPKQR